MTGFCIILGVQMGHVAVRMAFSAVVKWYSTAAEEEGEAGAGIEVLRTKLVLLQGKPTLEH